MVYDVFPFYDELDLLEIRMNILNSVVDKFVISECTTTQSGKEKPLFFKNNEDRFEKFKDKIIYNIVDDADLTYEEPFMREKNQKCSAINGLAEAKDNDIVLFSDMDEIPNPVKVDEYVKSFDESVIYHFAQRLFYFYLNYENVDHSLLAYCGDFPNIPDCRWLGSKMCSVKKLKEWTCDGIRYPEALAASAIRVPDGGWHFSYMGGSSSDAKTRIRNKVLAYSHSVDYNSWKYMNSIRIGYCLITGKDLFGRKAKFRKVPIDESYPEWLRENYEKYPHLIR